MNTAYQNTLRAAFIAGQRSVSFAEHLGRDLAETHFKNSPFFLKKRHLSPHYPNERHAIFMTPYLEDPTAKLIAQCYLEKLLTTQQTLLHGQLTTDNLTISEKNIQIIPTKSGFCGPIGFDLGCFTGNVFLAYYAYEYHGHHKNDVFEFQQWLLQQTLFFWKSYSMQFIELWNTAADGNLFNNAWFSLAEVHAYQKQYLLNMLRDMAGYAAIEMMHRITRLTATQDFESIPAAEKRICCENNALQCARQLLVHSININSIFQLTELIHQHTKILMPMPP